MDYYRTLGVDAKASPAEIALAYRDLNGHTTPETERAHRVLSSPRLREQYDRERAGKGNEYPRTTRRALSQREPGGWIATAGIMAITAVFIAAIIGAVYLSGSMAFQLRDAGNAALAEGDLHVALQKHERAAAIAHRDPGYRSDLARTYMALDRHQDAITEYTLALEIDPAHPEALLGRAQALGAIGAHELAQQDLTAAARLGIRPEQSGRNE